MDKCYVFFKPLPSDVWHWKGGNLTFLLMFEEGFAQTAHRSCGLVFLDMNSVRNPWCREKCQKYPGTARMIGSGQRITVTMWWPFSSLRSAKIYAIRSQRYQTPKAVYFRFGWIWLVKYSAVLIIFVTVAQNPAISGTAYLNYFGLLQNLNTLMSFVSLVLFHY